MNELASIVAHARTSRDRGAELLLATVVRVRGSAYRRAGARALLSDAAWLAGSVSGGCLEGDLVRRAFFRTRQCERVIVTYESLSEEDEGEVGLGCDGAVDLLLERLPPRARRCDPVDFFARCLEQEQVGAMVTVLQSKAAPEIGARVTVDPDGRVESEIDDAHLVAELATLGRAAIAGERPNAATALVADREVLVERVTPPLHVFVFGGGHDALPVASLARGIGWNVTVAVPHDRPSTRERFAGVARRMVGDSEELVAALARCARSAAVVMSHHYEHDRAALSALLHSPALYIGMLGPRGRTARMLDELARRGVALPPSALARLYAPVGLELGANGPHEIALAIAAEIQSVVARASAAPRRGSPAFASAP